MNYLSKITITRPAWLLLTISALALEATALFFQYVMNLEPCIMCVYQRLAILAIIIAGAIGSLGYQYSIARLSAFILWGTGAIWGLLIAAEHIEMQSNNSSLFFSCDIIPNFPSWAPLHEWIPVLFEVTGDCGEISWQFLGFSMPQWMLAIYAVYSLLFIMVFFSKLLSDKKP